MMGNDYKQQEKLKELLQITNITEEEFEKLSYKEKQKYFKAKNKLSNIVFHSRDYDGNGITYKKGEKSL